MEQWPQIVFRTDASDAQMLEDALFSAGALAVTYHDEHDQPILEPAPGEVPLWDSIRLVGLFPLAKRPADLLPQLALVFGRALPPYEWIALPDQQWERAWMDDFQPMQFGPALWICPTHCSPVDQAAVNVRLDPGLAFGSGTHPTTGLCLAWLGNNDMTALDVIDYGCGSGVLAVTAAMLGARHVIAVDIDPQAVEATKNNAASNGVSDRLRIGMPELTAGVTADLLLANILFQPLMELAPVFAGMTRPGGSLVLSGLLDEQVEKVMLRYNHWFAFKSHKQQNNWALLHATRHHDA